MTSGLENVHDGPEAGVDIVFLHGLRGNITKTWTKDGVLWPKDLLPQDVERSRIFLFGYDSGITHRDQSLVQKTEIHSDADDLCARLVAERSSTKTEDRPIIFVAHSLGGLVAAQILIHGERREESSNARAITRCLRGMIFLGTPFRGSGSAKPAETIRRVMSFMGIHTQQETLKLLGRDSERLDELTRAFPDVLNKRRTSQDPDDQLQAFFFYETKKTASGIVNLQVVEPESAQIPGCGDASPVDTDHLQICKYTSDKDHGYKLVVSAIAKSLQPLKRALAAGSINKTISLSDNAQIINNAMENINIQSQTFQFGPR
ncbi:Alpha/Beta hydrolase protein [Penicillium herquei]|nr:Alpha/Beta hydrolase protein [Penicillium herquei]